MRELAPDNLDVAGERSRRQLIATDNRARSAGLQARAAFQCAPCAWANLKSGGGALAAINQMRYLIGRYHEIALKGRNQWRFVDQVKQNLRDIFGDYRLGDMRCVGPRLMVAAARRD